MNGRCRAALPFPVDISEEQSLATMFHIAVENFSKKCSIEILATRVEPGTTRLVGLCTLVGFTVSPNGFSLEAQTSVVPERSRPEEAGGERAEAKMATEWRTSSVHRNI